MQTSRTKLGLLVLKRLLWVTLCALQHPTKSRCWVQWTPLASSSCVAKACRPSFRIAEIWVHIQQIPLLPAQDERMACTLIGSVVSAVLEARDAATASLVWKFLLSLPRLLLDDAIVIQLLSALRGKHHDVVEVITPFAARKIGRACQSPRTSCAALQALVSAPTEARRMFELALTHNMVCCFVPDPIQGNKIITWTFSPCLVCAAFIYQVDAVTLGCAVSGTPTMQRP